MNTVLPDLLAGAAVAGRAAGQPGAIGPRSRTILKPEQAFRYAVTAAPDALLVRWTIEPGHYLYQERMSFESRTPGRGPGLRRSCRRANSTRTSTSGTCTSTGARPRSACPSRPRRRARKRGAGDQVPGLRRRRACATHPRSGSPTSACPVAGRRAVRHRHWPPGRLLGRRPAAQWTEGRAPAGRRGLPLPGRTCRSLHAERDLDHRPGLLPVPAHAAVRRPTSDTRAARAARAARRARRRPTRNTAIPGSSTTKSP